MHLYEVLRRPLVTEKSTVLKEQSKYVFEVAMGANKKLVKEAVEAAFKVKVKHVNVVLMPGKSGRWGRFAVKPTPWKKAMVTLEPDNKIEFFEGV